MKILGSKRLINDYCFCATAKKATTILPIIIIIEVRYNYCVEDNNKVAPDSSPGQI